MIAAAHFGSPMIVAKCRTPRQPAAPGRLAPGGNGCRVCHTIHMNAPRGHAERIKLDRWVDRGIGALAASSLFIANALGSWMVERTVDEVVNGDDLRAEIFYKPMPQYAKTVVVPASTPRLLETLLDNSDSVAASWAELNGGGPADGVTFAIMLFGTADHPVVIENMRAASLQCRDPEGEPRAKIVDQTSGPFYGKLLEIDLDASGSPGVPRLEETPSEVKPWEFPLQVSRAEAERIDVVAHSSRDCDFTIEVVYRSGSNAEVLSVRNEGRPFVVRSASSASIGYRWVFSDDGQTMRIQP